MVNCELMKRCFGQNSPLYSAYHDNEWGSPCYDDQTLFEFLILEGAQAGLSWETILKKRERYRAVFHAFDPKKVASMSDSELELLCKGAGGKDAGIVRNRLKIYSARNNARIFLEIQKEFGSFEKYFWGFVDRKPIVNHWKIREDVPASTPLSEKISKDLKKRGMRFVGPTIIYAYMQAVGMVNDHLTSCGKRESHHHL